MMKVLESSRVPEELQRDQNQGVTKEEDFFSPTPGMGSMKWNGRLMFYAI